MSSLSNVGRSSCVDYQSFGSERTELSSRTGRSERTERPIHAEKDLGEALCCIVTGIALLFILGLALLIMGCCGLGGPIGAEVMATIGGLFIIGTVAGCIRVCIGA